MKWLLFLVIVAAIAFYFVFMRSPELKPVAVATPSASAPAPAPNRAFASAPAIHEKHIAPPGTWFLLQPVSITTDSGVVGITVGTKVTVLNDKTEPWRVSDGENQFDVQPEHLTNDLDVAAAVIQQEAEAKAALQAGIHDSQESARKAREQGAAWLAKQLELQRQQQAVAPFGGGAGQSPPPAGGSSPPSPFGRPAP